MTKHGFWHSGVREPKIPLVQVSPPPAPEEHQRGSTSREVHNELREFKARQREAPAKRKERKQIWGYYSDKTGKTYTKAQIQRFVDEIRKGEIPKLAIDKDSLVFHPPESERDLVGNIGEIHVAKGVNYPALEIDEGEVLVDPNIPYVHRILK
jgi:hypothetical protein